MTDPRLQELLNVASRLRELGRLPEAISAYKTLLAAFPALPDSWYNLGFLLTRTGKPEEALAAYDEALKRGVADPQEVHLNRAVIFSDHLAQSDKAREALQHALLVAPNYLPALINLANLEEDLGQKDAARSVYERAATVAPENAIVLSRLSGLGRAQSPDDPMIARLKTAISSGKHLPADLAQLQFALGRLLDTCGAYDQAYAFIEAANTTARIASGGRMTPYRAEAELTRADQAAAAFAAPASRTGGLSEPDPAPVFILGMFRSGSTLVEHVLGAHSRITPAGEIDMIPRIAHGLGGTASSHAAAPAATIREYAQAYLTRLQAKYPGALIVTDKRPDNFWHVGLIKRLFPNARIINTVRHPLDNLISVWSLYLDVTLNYSFSIEDIAGHIIAERRMMDHWNRLYPGDILTVQYEALVASPEAQVRRLLDFLGLAYEPGCLDFHKTAAPIRTASVWQVREPLNDRSIGRWRNYESLLRARPAHPALSALLTAEPPGRPV